MQIIQVKHGLYLYTAESRANISDSSVNTVQCRPILNRLEQNAEDEALKSVDDQILKSHCREDVQQSAKIEQHHSMFLKMLTDF